MTTNLIKAAALLSLFATGCLTLGTDRASPLCSADQPPAPGAVLTGLALDAAAGTTPFALDAPLTSAAGVSYSVSLLRFYVSRVDLARDDGEVVGAPLADASGKPLTYGVALVDYAVPDTWKLHVLAPPGHYASVSFAIGVPTYCANGGVLNHENAAEQSYPLDVDSDMYWAWNAGYTFFKIEGHANGSGSFVYHVGDDKHFSAITVAASLDVSAPAEHRISMDVNRLFVAPDGQARPDMTGVATSNVSHDGPESDMVVDNYTHSGVFKWID
jgi:hypothetical protein